MKTMTEVVVDCGPSMGARLGAFSSKLSVASTFVRSHLIQRMQESKTAEYGVLAVGKRASCGDDDGYRNFLHNQYGEGYEDVYEVVDMKVVNGRTLDLVETDLRLCLEPGDLVNGIIVGVDVLSRMHPSHKYNRIIVIITDGETALGLEDFDTILQAMQDKRIFVYVLMLGAVQTSEALISSSSSSSASSAEAPLSTKAHSARVLREVARLTGGRYDEAEDLAECLSLLAAAPGLVSRPQQRKHVLELAPYLRVPVVLSKACGTKSLPSLKRMVRPTVIAAAVANDNGDDDKDDDNDPDAAPRLQKVERLTMYIQPDVGGDDADEDGAQGGAVEVPFDARIKGFRYGSMYYPISQAEEANMKITGQPVVQVLGFVPAAAVPRHHFLQHAQTLAGSPVIGEAVEAVRALSDAMREEGMVALARMVSKEDADPFLAALVPSASGALLLHRLPFADDVRDYAFPSYDTDGLSTAQTRAVSSFVDATTLGPQEATHAIGRTFNPTRQAFMIAIAERVAEVHVASVDGEAVPRPAAAPPALQCFRSPWASVGEGEGGSGTHSKVIDALQTLSKAFPLTVTAAGSKVGKRRIYWGDLDIKSSGGGEKKVKIEVTGESQEPTTEHLARQADLDPRLREANQVVKARTAVAHFAEVGKEDLKAAFEGVVEMVAAIGAPAPVDADADADIADRLNAGANGNGNSNGNGHGHGHSPGAVYAPSEDALAVKRELLHDAMVALLPEITKRVTVGAAAGHWRIAAALVKAMRAAAP